MDFASFDECWKALGHLYDSSLETRRSVEELRLSVSELRQATGQLLSAVEKHQRVTESHERRLDCTEITVEAILEDLRRHREGPSPQ